MRIKTVIVDDEYLARQRIIKLLEEHDDVDIVGEAKNADDAVTLINDRNPDLVFLDIQMPGNNGFQVLKEIKVKKSPEIIFTTAFDQYALDAFRVHAQDYLLKPFDQDRFDESLKLAKEQLKLKRSASFNDQILNLLNDYQQEGTDSIRQFKIKDKGRESYIDVHDILFIETAGNYVILHCDDRQALYRATMNTIEEQLDSNEFLRIHRSYLVNKRFVKDHKYVGGNEFQFTIKNGKELVSAKSYKESIKRFLDTQL